MWSGSLDLGRISLAQLGAALPTFIERLADIEFDSDGIALVNGLSCPGLRLLSGQHLEAMATYAIVLAEQDRPQKLTVATIDEASDDRLVIVFTESDSQHSTDQRWELQDLTGAGRLRISCMQSTMKNDNVTYLFDLDADLVGLRKGTGPDPVQITASLGKHRCWMALGPEVHGRVPYRAGPTSARSAGLLTNAKAKLEGGVVKVWLGSIAAVLRHATKNVAGDAEEVLWHLTIGQLAPKLERPVRKQLARLAPSAA